jgi:hypothetical protein
MADVARLDPGKGLDSATELYAGSKAYATLWQRIGKLLDLFQPDGLP